MRKWLENDLKNSYLPRLKRMRNSDAGRREAKALLELMRDHWALTHGLRTLQQQQGCMDQVRRAIKDELGEEHWCLEVIKFSTEDYVELNNQKQSRVEKRNEAIQQIDNPDEIVGVAVRLLESPRWSEVAAGLAVVTGRRVSELLATAHFEKKTQWSVIFSGAAKRREESIPLIFEIPTLTTADRVLTALAKIRRELPDTQGMTPSEINRHYEQAVARACNEHFANLVPARDGKDSIYTHLFRAIYATIATFWYCPPAVQGTEFKAAIQGHYQVLDAKNPELRRSLAASRHYADYEISDRLIAEHQGKRKGIKLGHGGIEVIDQFKKQPAPAAPGKGKGRKKTPSSIRIWKEDKEILDSLFDRLGLDGDGKQEDRLRALLEWADQALLTAQQQEKPEPEEITAEEETIPPPVQDPLREDLQQLIVTMQKFVVATTSQLAQPHRTERQTTKPLPITATTDENSTGEEAPPKRLIRTKEQTIATINKVIDAVIALNNEEGRLHDEKWAITPSLFKSWSTSMSTVQEALSLRQKEIDQHHNRHQIEKPEKHNLVHRRKRKITDIISLEEDAE